MKKIGILFGVENSFPSALVEHINARNPRIRAEFVLTGAVEMGQAPRYEVIVDRISHDVPFYRALLKQAALNGTLVINNPFWAAADNKFFNYALASRLGVAVPPTVLLPHKQLPNGTSDKSMRNLEFPLDWESVFAAIGEHRFMEHFEKAVKAVKVIDPSDEKSEMGPLISAEQRSAVATFVPDDAPVAFPGSTPAAARLPVSPRCSRRCRRRRERCVRRSSVLSSP